MLVNTFSLKNHDKVILF